jgi:hypothetical protein
MLCEPKTPWDGLGVEKEINKIKMEKHNAVFRHVKVRRWRRDLARFVRKWLNKNLVPLSFDTDVSFETWIGEINQTEDRKNELRKIYAEGNTVYQRKYHKCKSS